MAEEDAVIRAKSGTVSWRWTAKGTPQTDDLAINEAARLFAQLPQLWEEATQEERRKLEGTIVERVYPDVATAEVGDCSGARLQAVVGICAFVRG